MRNIVIAMSAASALLATAAAAAVKITSIDFKNKDDKSVLEITADGPLTFEKQENAADKQVVLELKDAKLAKGLERKLDTSSFNSKVSLVSPYKVDGSEDVRVVVQLRDAVASEVVNEGNTLRLSVPVDAESTAAPAAPVEQPAAEQAQATPPAAQAEELAQVDVGKTIQEPTQDARANKNLDTYFQSRDVKRFFGKKITLQVRDTDINDVLRLIAEASGFNIIAGDDVKGTISLSLVDVPWDQVLDVVLNTKMLGAERNNNILRVVTLASLTAQKQAELQAKLAVEASAPRVTRVFPISYAKPGDLQKVLEQFGRSANAGGAAAAAAASISVDERTNSLIVRDTWDNIDRMKKLIGMLDTQTPQVMIEAKVIEATEGFSKNISGSFGFGKPSGGTQFVAAFAGANPIDQLIGSPGVFGDGSAVAKAAQAGGTFGVSPSVSFLPGIERLNAILNLGESENQLKIVSSPKTVVLNKFPATIVQGTPVLVPQSSFVAGVGNVPISTVQSADLNLTVTPTVTNDGNIVLTLSVTRAVPVSMGSAGSAVANRNMNTTVVVESGSTLVIGGIYTMTNTSSSAGFPILRKIPLIGHLFGSETDRTDRSELFIFVTPRVLNEKEAGLIS